MKNDIINFFEPDVIAVIGASNNEGKVGYSLMRNLNNFKGIIVPVNIHEEEILGKKAYKSVLNYEDKIELAVIAVPAKIVKSVLIECGKKKIKNVIIISAGFSEIGNVKGEEELKKIAKKYKIRILGSNCFGVVNPYLELDTSFAVSTPKKGDIAFISQSGALWSAVSDWSLRENFGFSKFASLGNMSDVNFSDLIEYLNKDENTRVIVLYIELLKDGKKFMEIAKKSKKPIIAIKAGQSEAGREATLSHTGSLAGSYEIYKAALKQSNVRIAESLTQAFDMAKLKKEIKGKKVVIVSNAGGPGALTADYFEEKNLDVVELPKKVVNNLNKSLPNTWSKGNPIDIVGDAKADRYKIVLEELSKNGFYDILIVILTPQKMSEVEESARALVEFNNKVDKVVLACWMGGEGVRAGKEILENAGIPCFFEPKRAVDALG